ncbi:MAG: hypothetical protein KDD19_21745 [Phaeodactylibacter sp.]|nr:hypothetical protein [Phaeodactylibacter sp.]MCB9053893.1 hypothetical protein [Lewinellaceae bacterium]
MGKSRNNFYLSKWYLDCMDEQGNAAIGYAATMRWRGLELPYTSLLLYEDGKGASERSRFQQLNWPSQMGDQIIWEDGSFGISGWWEADAPPLTARLYRSEKGSVDWQCFQPRSHALFDIADGPVIKGLGYAERLVLTVEPWKIPMEQLHWGRYLSDQDYLVWIEFRGSPSRQWVWHNGIPVEGAVIDEEGLQLPQQGIHLQLDRSGTLEAEKKIFNVVRSMVSYLPGFNRIVPRFFLNANEHKWRSRGKLLERGEVKGEGWAIHELVDFTRAEEL